VLSHLVSELEKDSKKSAPALVVVTPTESRARQLAQELRFFLGPHPDSDPALSTPWATVLPRLDVSPYVDLSPEPAVVQERLSALFRLAQGFTGPVLAVSAEALLSRVMPRAAFDRKCDLVGPGLVIPRDAFTDLLSGAGYRRMPLVEDPGCYAVRGGIVDVYPPVARRPFRVSVVHSSGAGDHQD
jgi:transcription-repair coupling factor (superfamily II helicase)